MLIGSSQRKANKEPCISIGGNVETQVNSVRYLGSSIDSLYIVLESAYSHNGFQDKI